MSGLTDLLLLAVPAVAVLGGLVLVLLALLHLSERHPLPRVPADRASPAVSALLLGISLAGLGLTYQLTGGQTGRDVLYLGWLLLAAASGVLLLGAD